MQTLQAQAQKENMGCSRQGHAVRAQLQVARVQGKQDVTTSSEGEAPCRREEGSVEMRFGSLRWGEQQRDLLLPTCSLRSNWGQPAGAGGGEIHKTEPKTYLQSGTGSKEIRNRAGRRVLRRGQSPRKSLLDAGAPGKEAARLGR